MALIHYNSLIAITGMAFITTPPSVFDLLPTSLNIRSSLNHIYNFCTSQKHISAIIWPLICSNTVVTLIHFWFYTFLITSRLWVELQGNNEKCVLWSPIGNTRDTIYFQSFRPFTHSFSSCRSLNQTVSILEGVRLFVCWRISERHWDKHTQRNTKEKDFQLIDSKETRHIPDSWETVWQRSIWILTHLNNARFISSTSIARGI